MNAEELVNASISGENGDPFFSVLEAYLVYSVKGVRANTSVFHLIRSKHSTASEGFMKILKRGD